jgi:hypothetical protein
MAAAPIIALVVVLRGIAVNPFSFCDDVSDGHVPVDKLMMHGHRFLLGTPSTKLSCWLQGAAALSAALAAIARCVALSFVVGNSLSPVALRRSFFICRLHSSSIVL